MWWKNVKLWIAIGAVLIVRISALMSILFTPAAESINPFLSFFFFFFFFFYQRRLLS
jgi:hypothetical protein